MGVWIFVSIISAVAPLQSQNLQVQSINNVQYADQLSGSDMCAKITSGIMNLPATGGTVDARGFQGTQACGSNPFSGVTKPVTLLIGAVKITTSVPWVIQTNGVHINCQGPAGSQIQYTGLANAPAIITFKSPGDPRSTSIQDSEVNNCGIHTAGLAVDGILFQGWHHNKIEGDSIWGVTNCGLHTEFAVVNTMKGIHVSGNDANVYGFSGSAPPNGMCFDQYVSASYPTTASTVIDPIVEGTTSIGLNLASAVFMVIQGGTSELGHGGFFIASGSYENTIIDTDFEANTFGTNPYDGEIDGYNTHLIGITGTNVLNIKGKNNYLIGGGFNSINVETGAQNNYINSSIGNNGGTLHDFGTGTYVDRLFAFTSWSVVQGWNGVSGPPPSGLPPNPSGCVNFVDYNGITHCVPYY